jgi:rare lipoprotein A
LRTRIALFALAAALAGCGTMETRTEPPVAEPAVQAPEPPASAPAPKPRAGRFYLDDGPGDKPPAGFADIPDAQPKREPLRQASNRPYTAFGRQYVPLTALQPFRQRGMASWYGKRYHGQRTSSGEVYDMYAMTAAHPTLPIPSYARVTSVANGRSVVVRINDRGPFLQERIIDLSYTAAYKLGFVNAGSAEVELEAVLPAEAPVVVQAPIAPVSTRALYLQIGAFASRENAEEFRGRVARQLAWLGEPLEVQSSGNIWRLHVGPYASDAAARPVAERIEAELKLRPLIVAR